MRISIFVDGTNFFYMQKDKLHWWIDPKKVLDYLSRNGDEIVDAFYYVGVDSNVDSQQDNYLKALAHMGYCLERKELKTIYLPDGTHKQKANLDVEIVLDMFNTIDLYDKAVLVSGDGDFQRALRLLRERGKKFLVMSTSGIVAREIREVAGMHYIDFNDIRNFVEKPQKGIYPDDISPVDIEED
ncbi:MAG: NYN domain-containing protein [Candidatus Coatesbacteria bacterium]|nr:NYN domain-containing protein [Candidatus Coatesbacteria bacterium]